MLTGTALRAMARDLAIPGRSKMSADELRAAIDVLTVPPVSPIPSPPMVPDVNLGDLFTLDGTEVYWAPLDVPRVPQVTPWTSRNGKHKCTRTRARYSHRSL